MGFLEIVAIKATLMLPLAILAAAQQGGMKGFLSTFQNVNPIYDMAGNLCGIDVNGVQIAKDTVIGAV